MLLIFRIISYTGILETLYNLWVLHGKSGRFQKDPAFFKRIAENYVQRAEGFRNRLGLSDEDRRVFSAKTFEAYRVFAYGLGGGKINGAVLPPAGHDPEEGFRITDLSKGRRLWEKVVSAQALRESGIDAPSIQKMRDLLESIRGLDQKSAVLQILASNADRETNHVAIRLMYPTS